MKRINYSNTQLPLTKNFKNLHPNNTAKNKTRQQNNKNWHEASYHKDKFIWKDHQTWQGGQCVCATNFESIICSLLFFFTSFRAKNQLLYKGGTYQDKSNKIYIFHCQKKKLSFLSEETKYKIYTFYSITCEIFVCGFDWVLKMSAFNNLLIN